MQALASPAVIAIDDPRADDVRALLERHLAFANATSLPEDMHALDVDGLCAPSVTFFSLRDDGELLGVAALKRLDDEHAEIKSMHTAAAARGRGIARSMLEWLRNAMRAEGWARVYWMTKADNARARRLYDQFTQADDFVRYVLAVK